MNIYSHILGFPRIGSMRELKFAQEKYWNNEIDISDLFSVGKNIRKNNLKIQKSSGLDFVCVGDFAWYDNVLNNSMMLGNIPKRYKNFNRKINIDTLFRIARGFSYKKNVLYPSEMTKWFNTNYHYIVPEFYENMSFKFTWKQILEELDEAIKLKFKKIKPILLGPISYLWLGKIVGKKKFSKLELLDKILPIYKNIFMEFENRKIDWVQIDEPILTLDISKKWLESFIYAYNYLNNKNLNILLTTYFGNIYHNINIIKNIPVSGIHIDYVNSKNDIKKIIKNISEEVCISLGVINGRNIWRSNLKKIYEEIYFIKKLRRKFFISSSCSLMHVPVDLSLENKIDKALIKKFSFAVQKCDEICLLVKSLKNSNKKILYNNVFNNTKKKKSLYENLYYYKKYNLNRKNSYIIRRKKQNNNLKIPILPTTTIGSFPQTKEIRSVRLKFKENKIDLKKYNSKIKKYIIDVIRMQENLDLDVLVHGEPERNDMVEYFAQHLEGFVFTEFGWVQSYGSRCVKPPIIVDDIYRKYPITIKWIKYAQSNTTKLVKGILTGPITILLWSFCREDISTNIVVKQIAISLREEIKDIENIGIKIIQVDEPAFAEGLPLRKKFVEKYLCLAIDSFKLSTSVVRDETQIHTHMCYSDFKNIINAIVKLDVDVITIESSRSQLKLLDYFKNIKYINGIGPGVYDIHTTNIPNVNNIKNTIIKYIKKFNIKNLWINPDCGLKTRNWIEVKKSLKNMVKATKEVRNEI
ncbi:MAG: 5-methyltetrahydropteroyltriglutamate--homocysteine S-methyltransferase [Buchnera aphidicola (Ceratovacuna japonica)]